MKTFKDLKFKPHPNGFGKAAAIKLDDGTAISVICGSSFYYCGTHTYEMMSDRITQNGGVRGYLTEKQITAHMIYVQKNPKRPKAL